MNKIIDKYSEEIWNIYNENFPSYLKEPKRQFVSKLSHYKFWDILFNNNQTKTNINNFNLKHSGLNKETTYSNLNFSVFLNKLQSQSIDEVIGFALFNFFPKNKLLHLDYLSLSKSVQGKGFGKTYLQYLISNIYKKNPNKFSYLVLECEDHLVKFYKSNGFVQINFNYYYKGIKMNLMVYNTKKISWRIMHNIALFLTTVFNQICIQVFKNNEVQIIKFTTYYLLNIHWKFRFHIVDNFQKKIQTNF